MCGRYALSLRPSQVRHRLADQNMPAEDAPSDDDQQLRQSYNFAPGYHGLIYRANTSDRGTDATPLDKQQQDDNDDGEPSPKKVKLSSPSKSRTVDGLATKETKYKLQSAKWGLIPFWTKRPPDYGSMLRTINCRDDSLAQSGGMWNTMKQRKRCIVVAEGFYEWLKKNNGKEKIPHFVKRKDGGLMCFAGLWDCVQYERDSMGNEVEAEKLYTYTVITTDSNKQLKFLHDRMPVILEAGSEEMRTWLDPGLNGWNKELQSMLKPFQGDLECYPVDRAVGKVGNNSPSFVVPVDSKENKKNIANFFGKQGEKASPVRNRGAVVEKEDDENRETTVKAEDPESNAPLPKPPSRSDDELSQAIRRDTSNLSDNAMLKAADENTERNIRKEEDGLDDDDLLEAEKSPPRKVWTSPRKPKASPAGHSIDRVIKHEEDQDGGLNEGDLQEAEKSPPRKVWTSPSKPKAAAPSPAKPSQTSGKTRSAISNGTQPKTPSKGGDKKITSFFGGK